MRRVQIGAAVAVLAVFAAATWDLRALQAQAGPQAPQIASLSEAGQGLSITQSTPTGRAMFAASRGQGVLLPVAETDTAADRASVFVDLYGSAFGLADRSHVQLARAPRRDALGLEHVRFQQVHMGVPVAGADFLVHLKGARAMAANGHVLERMPAEMTATVQPAAAEGVARRLMARDRVAHAATAKYGAPRLEIFNHAFLRNQPGDLSRLAWFIEATGHGLREFIWIDARTSGVLLHFSQLDTLKDRQVYNANFTGTIPGTLARTEGGPPIGNPDVDSAYNMAGFTYDYYSLTFSRDSFNGAGATIISTVNFDDGFTCPNAFWNGAQMVYCNGWAAADDVVAHELTHAVTQYEANLFYYVQSGALNESFSDIFGETVDLVQNVTAGDTAAVRWEMGEDLPGIGALRDMMNPTLFGNPGKMSDMLWFWCDTNQDGGGVHTNSGIPNHAYALMVDGGTYNGYTITGIGFPKAARIQYRALSVYLTSSSGFLDDFNAVNQSCNDLVGVSGITLADCSQVQNAMLAVEMNAQWGCTDQTQIWTPSLCPAGGSPSYLLQEGFETGAPGWTTPSTTPYVWSAQTFYVNEGNFSAIGLDPPVDPDDPDAISDHSLQSPSPGLILPTGAWLIFDHAYSFDAGFDGGVVEYSVDNGANWLDAGGFIDAGLVYDSAILDGSGNPLANRPAFTQFSSSGYQKTRLNLSSLSGQTVRFRFRVGTDSIIGGLGWFIDNVKAYSCPVAAGAPVITVPPFPQSATAGGTATFTVTASGDPTLRYQWLRNGSPIAGATTSSLTLTNVHQRDYAYYSVIISNGAGTATSDGALLLVGFTGAPLIAHQPANKTVTAGQTAQFVVEAVGITALTYQWEVSTTGGGSWVPLANDGTYSGVLTNTLSVITNIGLNNNLYRVVISGGGSATSNPALLNVLAANLITNGNFAAGETGWAYFDNPGGSGEHNVTAGVFQWNRPGNSSTQSVIFQNTGAAVAGTPLIATFDIGNSSNIRKRVSVLMIDADFSDITVCTFWLEPAAPLRTYRMRTHTTKPWANAAIYFYAATTGNFATTNGYLRLDNVSVNYNPTGSNLRTECEDPTSPLPPGGAEGPNLLVNGNFSAPLDPPWGTFGQISGAINNGVFEFLKLAGAPAGVLLQPTTLGMAINQFLTVQLDLGNSSALRKRVTVLVHDNDFSDLAACTFWLPAGLPLSTYQMRLRATKAWTNATVSVYPATTGLEQWIKLDNVSLKRTPGLDINGTECFEPAEILVPPSFAGEQTVGGGAPPPEPDAFGAAGAPGAPGRGRVPAPRSFARLNFDPMADEWASGLDDRGANLLRWRRPLELDTVSAASLAFRSSVASGAGTAEVQVSLDGLTWRTVARVPPDELWTDVEVDLSEFAGQRLYVQFAFTPLLGETATWRVANVRVVRRD